MILFFECRAKMYSVVRSVLIYSFLKVKVLIAQLYLIFCDPTDCSLPPGLPGILQARILEWVAIPFSRGSS